MNEVVRIGFVPLVDCALLAIAQEQGFFARQHVDVELRKAQSWNQVRDKLRTRELDAAHMLITMPLQEALATAPEPHPLLYAFTLSRDGNGIILANALWNEGARDGASLAAWLNGHAGRKLRMGVVFPRGTQEYFLRSWLSQGNLSLGDRITLTIIPPQEMVGRLRKGEIDGFCVGEPWSRRAAASKLGRLVAESGRLLPGMGEKVLGVRSEWHRSHPLEHTRILRALHAAAEWMSDPAHFSASAEIVASKRYVNTSRSVVEEALHAGASFHDPARNAFQAWTRPAHAHAEWYLDQMAKWGHAGGSASARLEITSLCLDAFYASSCSGIPSAGARSYPVPRFGAAPGTGSDGRPARRGDHGCGAAALAALTPPASRAAQSEPLNPAV